MIIDKEQAPVPLSPAKQPQKQKPIKPQRGVGPGGVLRPATAKEMIYNADLQFTMRRGERLKGIGLREGGRDGVIRGINRRDFLLGSNLARFQFWATVITTLT